MASILLNSLLLILCEVEAYEGYTIGVIDSLIRNLTLNYNTRVRPPIKNSETLYVNVSFMLMSVNEYDAVSGVLDVTGAMALYWTDNRLSWDPDDYSGISEIQLKQSDIWFPRLIVQNQVDGFKYFAHDSPFLVRVFHTGTILFGIGDNVRSSCTSDMTHYPFDIQKCYI